MLADRDNYISLCYLGEARIKPGALSDQGAGGGRERGGAQSPSLVDFYPLGHPQGLVVR